MEPPTQLDDLTGKTLVERYHIHGRLGQGGMGAIYTAHDDILDRDVAIKTVPRNNLNDVELVRFHREGKAASTVRHPNVIQMLDFGVLETGQPFIVMELIKGISISQLLKERGPQSALFTLQILEQIAEGMSAVHKSGIVHRDLKTSNIMIVNLDTIPLVRILDFGIAKSVAGEEQTSTVTRAGQIFGSPNYMSPQQIRGESLDQRADVYSLGCIAFEMLTGRTMFEGETVMELVTKHLNEPAPRLWQVGEQTYPMELERLVAHMVAKSTDERFASMDVVIENIRDVRTVLEERLEQERLAEKVSANKQATDEELRKRNRLSAQLLLSGALVAVGLSIAVMNGVVHPMLKKEQEIVKVAPAKIENNRRKERLDRSQSSLAFLELGDQTAGDMGVLMDQSGDSTLALNNALKRGGRRAHIILLNSKVTLEDASKIVLLNPTKLNLRRCVGVNDAFLQEVSKAKAIQMIDLDLCKGISPKGFRYLSSLPKLTTLFVRGCDLTDAHLKEIGQTSSLLQLFIERNHQVTLKGVERLGGKVLPVKIVVDQPNLYLLSAEKQKALLLRHNVQLYRSDNVTAESFSLSNMMDLAGIGDMPPPSDKKVSDFADEAELSKFGSKRAKNYRGGFDDE